MSNLWYPGREDDVFISIGDGPSKPVAAFPTIQLCDTLLIFWNSSCPPHLEIPPVNKHHIGISNEQSRRVITAIMEELADRDDLPQLQLDILAKMRQGIRNGKFLSNIS